MGFVLEAPLELGEIKCTEKENHIRDCECDGSKW